MRDSSVNILFQLLRAALGNEAAGTRLEGLDLGSVSGEVWKEVIDLSFEQGVAAVAVDGLGFAHDNDGSLRLAQGKHGSPTNENRRSTTEVELTEGHEHL